MLTAKKFLACSAALFAASLSFGAEGGGVAPSAAKLLDFGNGWAITNSMATGWATSTFIIFLLLVVIRKPTILPGKGQAVFESVLEGLRELFEPLVGKKAFPFAFPLLATFFIFILIHNWMGLLPGVGTVGWGHEVDGHFHLTSPWIRPFNSDFNGTIA